MSIAEIDDVAMNDLRTRLAAQSMAPLWDMLHTIVPREPNKHYRPHLWRYDDIRAFLIQAGEILSAEQAERRVVVLANPDLHEAGSATPTLFAGVQMVLPGEIAPAHRHTQSALRLILEGEDAITAVEGEEIFMRPGDLVLTPNWTWHDHANPSSKPMLWLDGLDIPLVRFLNGGFSEKSNSIQAERTRESGDGRARFGAGMAPADYAPRTKASPKIHYPYAECRDALHTISRSDVIDDWQGWRMRYVNPVTGGPVLPTISCFLRLLPKGFRSRAYRATDSRVFSAVEGNGVVKIGDQKFSFAPRDVFCVPTWTPISFETAEETVLFEMSDRGVQEAFDLWREDRLA